MWIDEHLDWKFTVREVRKSASRALSALYTKFIACGGMDFDIYEKLYENLVQPVLLYGSSIWGISEHKQLETVQNRACRYFLGAFKTATNLAVRGDTGWTTVKTKQNIEVMRLFFKLSNLEDDRIVRTTHETNIREEPFNYINVLNNTFNAFNSDEKFDFIMNCDHAQVLLAKTLHLMFKRRKINLSGSSPRSNFDFSCGNTVVKYDSKYRYLGMWIDEHLDWKFTVREVRKSASRALSALYTKFIACGGMDFDIYEKLYENLVQPVLLYGSSIWGISEHKQLETVQNRACRYFLGAFKNSTNLAVRGDMGWTTVKTKQNIEVMRLFFKLSNLEDDRIVRTIHETSKTKQRSWHSRVLALLRKSELNFLINLNITTKQKLRMAQDKLTAIDQEKWLIDVFDDKNSVNGNKLRTFRRFKNNCKTSLFVKTINFHIREELFNYINALNNTFNAFNSDEKFDFIMNCDHAQVLLAKTLHLMFKRRKINL
ncbi:unnamed protein product [Mytilus edulis]|uniref:Uncharacterized protein n=1 Tax=Mytilus edulis TaxID=6550 RepID=A0A8S3THZ7_MYTED|nr:unnamed protein product [Mytilus edulis]